MMIMSTMAAVVHAGRRGISRGDSKIMSPVFTPDGLIIYSCDLNIEAQSITTCTATVFPVYKREGVVNACGH